MTEQRYKAVLAVIGDGRTVGEVARDWGISASAVQNDSGMGSSVSEQKRRRLGGKSPIGLQAGDSLPVGTLTFLMTDIEGSTKAWDASPSSAKRAIERHDRIVLEQVEKNQGQIVESGREGDSVLAVFRQATDAVSCAVDSQRSLQREEWPAGIDLRVCVAVHTGEAELRSGHYIGAPLYRCARLMSTAYGGQILVSGATAELVADNLPTATSLRDLGQHRLRDLSRPEHVYQVDHPDLHRDFPPLKSLEPEPWNLPQQLTSFVGRQQELAQLRELLNSVRLLTLTGPGGIGKSRLAIEVARTSADSSPDGTWWVDLTPIDDPSHVAGTVATALHLNSVGPASEGVTSWLSNKQGLILLDNCEHLVSGCRAFCEAVLRGCPGIRIVATSRIALGVSGESRWPVSALTNADALSLFEQRGQLVVPSFKVTDLNREEIAQICRRLDDLPLAIELAASRLGMMTERQISARLADSFQVLSTSRSNDPRHLTMTATIDWSYQLLTESEATLFRRLSVFRGGFTLDSAQTICRDRLIPDVLDTLSGLVEKSMILVERLSDGDIRYRLLESQAEYAEAKLDISNESDDVRRRHYEYFLAEMISRSWTLAGPRGGIVPTKSEETWKVRELANSWAAMRWARHHVSDLGLQLATEVLSSQTSLHQGDLSQARAWLSTLLEESPAQGLVRLGAMAIAAWLAREEGDYAAALIHARAAETLARSSSEIQHLVLALLEAGNALDHLGQLNSAQSKYKEALRLAKGTGNARLLADIRISLGDLALSQGRYEFARQTLAETIASLSSIGDILWMAGALETMANAELGCGDHADAERTWQESLSMSRETGDYANVATCFGGLSRAATAREDHSRAVRLAAAHTRLAGELSYSDPPFWLRELDRSLKMSRSSLGQRMSDEAWNQGLAMERDRAMDYALEKRHEEAIDSGPLSRREVEVARLVAGGMTNREIAEKLFISERTAEGHLERIRNKLGVRSRTEVATWAVERGLALLS